MVLELNDFLVISGRSLNDLFPVSLSCNTTIFIHPVLPHSTFTTLFQSVVLYSIIFAFSAAIRITSI